MENCNQSESKIFIFSLIVTLGMCFQVVAEPLILIQRGQAGIKLRNNRYIFEVKNEIENPVLNMWVHGLDGTDSYGAVEIVNPNGKRRTAFTWSPTKLKRAERDVNNPIFKNGFLLSTEVDDIIQAPGHYRVEFIYKKGKKALIIQKVQISSGPLEE